MIRMRRRRAPLRQPPKDDPLDARDAADDSTKIIRGVFLTFVLISLEVGLVIFSTTDEPLLNEAVSDADIAGVVSRWTGIPVDKMLTGERDKLLHMEESLRARVVGQNEAVIAVSNAVRRSQTGLQDPSRPIGSFLFLGPTGVGKTELCKSLAHFLFDDEAAMVRIDMSEYMERHSVARLIGAPLGYVGYEEGAP